MTRLRRLLLLVALLAVGPALLSRARADDELAALKQRLLDATHADDVARALDRLQARVGTPNGFPDDGAFADYLASLPSPHRDHPAVRLRRGFALMRARRSKDAMLLLERCVAEAPDDGHAAAYLAECLRLEGRLDESATMLVRAARLGFDAPYLEEAVVNAATLARSKRGSAEGDDLPAYARILSSFLEVRPKPALHALLARFLVEDTEGEQLASRRAQWARLAAEHARSAARDLPVEEDWFPPMLVRIARQVSVLESPPRPTDRAIAFDLLAAAVRRGMPRRHGDPHAWPEALLDLAEIAIDVRRYEPAARLLAMREEVGPTPRTERLARRLPPDIDPP